jgi:hypothetical protein
LAPACFSANITLFFDAGTSFNCSTTNAPFVCITNSGAGSPLSPPGTPAQFATTLGTFANIQFSEVTISGAPVAAANGVFTFASNGSDFSYAGTTLSNTGTITSNALSGTTVAITDAAPTELASVDSGLTLGPVYFANGTVTVNAALLSALGVTGSYQAWLASDTGCNYPEGQRDPQTTGPNAGANSGACAVGFSNGSTNMNAESQYFGLVIQTIASPEPSAFLLLGFGLVLVGCFARRHPTL